jgi:putative ABC transport system permease protein
VAISDIGTLRVNSRALLFTFCLAVLAGVMAGIAPAWQNSRPELNDALKEGGRTTAGRGPLRKVFVVAELALALILLIGACLMVKGFVALASASPEIQPERLLTFTLSLPKSKYPEPRQVRRFYQQELENIRALPAVESAALISGLPYSFYDNAISISVEGQAPLPPGQLPKAMMESVSGEYFRTMLLPLRRGRSFDDRDTAETRGVAPSSWGWNLRKWKCAADCCRFTPTFCEHCERSPCRGRAAAGRPVGVGADRPVGWRGHRTDGGGLREGIAKGDLAHVFEPFFTTKQEVWVWGSR